MPMRKWLVALCVLLVLWDRYGSRLGLNADRIVAVSPGMTMEEVRAILGELVRKEVRHDIRFFCPCNEEQICWDERTTWTYTRKPLMRALSDLGRVSRSGPCRSSARVPSFVGRPCRGLN